MRLKTFVPFLFLSWFVHAEKPNVLLILVDDLKPAMGCYGDKHAITPAMDALAKRGMRFDLAYCNQAVCAPSRFVLNATALWNGATPANLSVKRNMSYMITPREE